MYVFIFSTRLNSLNVLICDLLFGIFKNVHSQTNEILSNLEWFLFSIIRISSDEILKQQLRISEITCIIIE